MSFLDTFVQILKYLGCFVWLLISLICVIVTFDEIIKDEKDKYSVEIFIISLISLIMFITFVCYKLQIFAPKG